jgi:hypothetical protein
MCTLCSLIHTQKTYLSITHQIAPNQTRLIWRFFQNRLPKKITLVDMNTLLILLSLRTGYHRQPGIRISHILTAIVCQQLVKYTCNNRHKWSLRFSKLRERILYVQHLSSRQVKARFELQYKWGTWQKAPSCKPQHEIAKILAAWAIIVKKSLVICGSLDTLILLEMDLHATNLVSRESLGSVQSLFCSRDGHCVAEPPRGGGCCGGGGVRPTLPIPCRNQQHQCFSVNMVNL